MPLKIMMAENGCMNFWWAYSNPQRLCHVANEDEERERRVTECVKRRTRRKVGEVSFGKEECESLVFYRFIFFAYIVVYGL